ncbi:MAG: hypothetical protein ABT27_21150 [Lysobacteraceae bacterium SCN 69-25]|nr:MAG: hypothetical protein ABT27_21150 [Xanthomonadaceae bacterium SCN 69-25]
MENLFQSSGDTAAVLRLMSTGPMPDMVLTSHMLVTKRAANEGMAVRFEDTFCWMMFHTTARI